MDNKFKKNIKEILINVSAFGIYIVAQQMLLMPFLSKVTDSESFSFYVVFLTIFNIICTVIGEDLGNVRIVNLSNGTNNSENTYKLVLNLLMIIIFPVCLVFVCVIFNRGLLFYLLSVGTFIVGVKRFYLLSKVRFIEKYHLIVISNIAYIISILISMSLYSVLIENPMWIFFISEIISYSVLFFLTKSSLTKETHQISQSIKQIFRDYSKLSMSSLILNLAVYLDRFTIIPLVGVNYVSSYYSTTSMSKLLSLITNPLSNWLFIKLSRSSQEGISKIWNLTIRALIPAMFLLTIISGSVSLIGVAILYPENLENVWGLLIPVSIATSASLITAFLKPVILIQNKSDILLKSNLVYAICFFLFAVILSRKYGVVGFAYSSSIGRIIQLMMNLILGALKSHK